MSDFTRQAPPTEPPRGDEPTCWNCGYVLRGLKVEDACPECGQKIWGPRTRSSEADGLATKVMVWGIVSLCTFFVCIGPLAGLLTIPAFVYYGKFRALHKAGAATVGEAKTAKSGIICARIAAVLSVLVMIVYVGLFAMGELV